MPPGTDPTRHTALPMRGAVQRAPADMRCSQEDREGLRFGTTLHRGIDNEGAYQHLRVQGERVDDVVHEDVALMKMDVEGFEPHVLEVATPADVQAETSLRHVAHRPSWGAVASALCLARCSRRLRVNQHKNER